MSSTRIKEIVVSFLNNRLYRPRSMSSDYPSEPTVLTRSKSIMPGSSLTQQGVLAMPLMAELAASAALNTYPRISLLARAIPEATLLSFEAQGCFHEPPATRAAL